MSIARVGSEGRVGRRFRVGLWRCEVEVGWCRAVVLLAAESGRCESDG